jgi:GTPase SAR1 family protein/phosphopantetheine adenylyltransferase
MNQHAKRILIMGLPGAGKTYFAERLKYYLENYSDISHMPLVHMLHLENLPKAWKAKVNWFNADEIRKKFNDWDFTKEGRIRQSLRMFQFALECSGDFVICDFVAPLPEMRHNFKADWTIWIDTIDQGRYEDTNKAFVAPEIYDFRINEQNAEKWVPFVGQHILQNKRRPIFDWKKETVQMLGRWQPWHAGHRALFERAIAKTGQVCIMIRDCQGWQGSNPFAIEQVTNLIKRDLDPFYQGQYTIQVVPNIVNITYGRDVGYKIEQETFDESITSISGTKIREEMTKQGLL